jgi:hypothetical protein
MNSSATHLEAYLSCQNHRGRPKIFWIRFFKFAPLQWSRPNVPSPQETQAGVSI